MHTGNPGHLKNFDYLGRHRYFLTFCAFARRRHFTTAERVDVVRSQILRAAKEDDVAIIADCYMPDHVHMLAEGLATWSDCRRFITRAKQFSGYHFRSAFGERLWQRYGYERVLRRDETTVATARYILENPVRAGLAANVTDYPFSGSSVYTIDQIMEATQLMPPSG